MKEAEKFAGEQIDVNDEQSLNLWSHILHIDERTLRAAIAETGGSVQRVLVYLNEDQPAVGLEAGLNPAGSATPKQNLTAP